MIVRNMITDLPTSRTAAAVMATAVEPMRWRQKKLARMMMSLFPPSWFRFHPLHRLLPRRS
jgi:hypothetical protein